jgi:hypothetical protein
MKRIIAHLVRQGIDTEHNRILSERAFLEGKREALEEFIKDQADGGDEWGVVKYTNALISIREKINKL